MSRRLLAWTLAAVVVACAGALVDIPVSESAATTIPAATPLETLLGDLGFGGFTQIDLTEDEELKNQGVEPGDIVDVRLTRFTLTVIDPPDGDLSFLDELAFSASAPGLPKVRIASSTTFPPGERTVELELEDVDLTDYVTSESMTITTDATGGRPDEATTIEAAFTLIVGVTSQGACKAIQGDAPGQG